MEKPQTGLDDCLRILLSCFRARMSAFDAAASAALRSRRRRRSTRGCGAGDGEVVAGDGGSSAGTDVLSAIH